MRWAGEVNLSISVESLKISDEVGGMVSSDYYFAQGVANAKQRNLWVGESAIAGKFANLIEIKIQS